VGGPASRPNDLRILTIQHTQFAGRLPEKGKGPWFVRGNYSERFKRGEGREGGWELLSGWSICSRLPGRSLAISYMLSATTAEGAAFF